MCQTCFLHPTYLKAQVYEDLCIWPLVLQGRIQPSKFLLVLKSWASLTQYSVYGMIWGIFWTIRITLVDPTSWGKSLLSSSVEHRSSFESSSTYIERELSIWSFSMHPLFHVLSYAYRNFGASAARLFQQTIKFILRTLSRATRWSLRMRKKLDCKGLPFPSSGDTSKVGDDRAWMEHSPAPRSWELWVNDAMNADVSLGLDGILVICLEKCWRAFLPCWMQIVANSPAVGFFQMRRVLPRY